MSEKIRKRIRIDPAALNQLAMDWNKETGIPLVICKQWAGEDLRELLNSNNL